MQYTGDDKVGRSSILRTMLLLQQGQGFVGMGREPLVIAGGMIRLGGRGRKLPPIFFLLISSFSFLHGEGAKDQA